MVEPIDFSELDDTIQTTYLNKFHGLYPYSLYDDTDKLLNDIKNKVVVVWAVIENSQLIGIILTYSDSVVLNATLVMEPHTLTKELLTQIIFRIEDHAQKNGCKMIEMSGRKGWEKLFKEYGYVFSSILMHKVF